MRCSVKKWGLIVLILLLFGAVAARLYLPIWLKDYVNNTLADMGTYSGSVSDIDVHLWRGAYTIRDLTIHKKQGKIPVPFVDFPTMDVSLHWRALLHGRVVAKIILDEPKINFAINQSGTVRQTGEGVDWTQKVKQLAPVDINLLTIHDGTVSYRDFSTSPQVDLPMKNIEGTMSNLRNVEDKDKPLPSEVHITARSIGNGDLKIDGHMNILKPFPDMAIISSLENVNLPALNNYFEAFAALHVDSGMFDLYSEVNVKNGTVTGYVKPIARHMKLLSVKHSDNPFQIVWQTTASMVVAIFTNHGQDQFATKVPLEGNLNHIETSNWEAFIGIMQNAFVEAFRRAPDGIVSMGTP